MGYQEDELGHLTEHDRIKDVLLAQDVRNPASAASVSLSATYGTGAGAATHVASVDTAALQAAHDSLPASGGTILLRPGLYLINTVTFTKQVKLVGSGGTSPLGITGTILDVNSSTSDGLVFNIDACILEDITVRNISATKPTAGVGIRFLKGDWAHLNRVTVIGFYDDVSFDTGYYYTITDCRIYDPARYGLHLQNTTPGQDDFGDQSITSTVITSYFHNWDADAAVKWESGGGLKFVGNKINGFNQPSAGHAPGLANGGGRFKVGLDATVADGANTTDLIITGNSIENCTVAMVRVAVIGVNYTGFFQSVVIVGNEIGFGYFGVIGVVLDGHSLGHLRSVIIDGNAFTSLPNQSIYATEVTGLSIGKNIHNEVIGANVHLGPECYGVDVATQASREVNTLVLVDETAAGFGNVGPFGNIEHEYARGIPATVTNAAAGELFQFDVAGYGSGWFELTITGQVSGIGSAVRKIAGYFFRDTGAVTLQTPYQVDATGAAAAVVVTLDTATAGTVKVNLKLPAGGSSMMGRATLRLDGSITRVLRS